MAPVPVLVIRSKNGRLTPCCGCKLSPTNQPPPMSSFSVASLIER